MAVSIGSLVMDLRASTKGLRRDAAKAAKEGRRLGNKYAKAVAAGAAGATAIITKEFADFQNSFAEVKTITKGTREELRFLENQTIALAKSLGTDLDESAQGLYQTISAGIPKENAITFLETASKGAVAGVTDIKTSVDGLSTVVNAFGIDASQAEKVSDVMFTTVKNGKTTFEELSSSIADVAPLAATMGVGFEEVFAATATLTKQGTKTSVAMTQIRSSIVALTKPTADMEKLFKRLNVETGQQLIDQHGLAGALQQLNSVASKPELAKAMGRVEGLNAVLGLSGKNARMFAKDLEDMQNSAGATDEAFWEMQNTLTAFLKNVKSIILGSVFPLMNAAYDSLVERVGGTQNLLAKTREKVTGFVEVIVKGFGYIGNAMRGWELIIKNGQVQFSLLFEGVLRGANFAVKGIETIKNKVRDLINEVIDNINYTAEFIPGLEKRIERLAENTESAFSQELTKMTDGAIAAREELVDEMVDLLEKPLPSDEIDKWLASIKEKTAEAATSISKVGDDMRKPFEKPIIPDTVVNDTETKTGRIRKHIEKEFVNPVEVGFRAINDQVSGLVRGTMSVNDALTNVAQTLVTTVIQGFVQMGAQMLLQQTTLAMGIKSIQTSAMAASAATVTAAAGAALASWAPAAMAASIATLGGAAGAGVTSYLMALAGGMAGTVAIGGIGNMAMNAVNIGTGKKRGGPVSPGTMYPVHEEGLPEFFRPDVSGEVIPLANMPKEVGYNGGGGNVYHINQTFTGGVTRADLQKEAKEIEKRTAQGILEGISRGGQFRRGMQR